MTTDEHSGGFPMTGGELSAAQQGVRDLWRECAEKGLTDGIGYPTIVRTLFGDIDAAEARVAAVESEREKYFGMATDCPYGIEGHCLCDCAEAMEARAESAEARVAAVEGERDAMWKQRIRSLTEKHEVIQREKWRIFAEATGYEPEDPSEDDWRTCIEEAVAQVRTRALLPVEGCECGNCASCHRDVYRARAEAAEAEVARLTAELDHALASAASMDHFAEVAVRCEAKSNEYAAENRRLAALVEAGLALADEWERDGGPGSAAENALGRQVVSVEFVVAKIRAALGGTA